MSEHSLASAFQVAAGVTIRSKPDRPTTELRGTGASRAQALANQERFHQGGSKQ